MRLVVGLGLAAFGMLSALQIDLAVRGLSRQARGGWSSLVVNGSIAHGVRLEFREYSQAGRP
jgi:hypothetical protein